MEERGKSRRGENYSRSERSLQTIRITNLTVNLGSSKHLLYLVMHTATVSNYSTAVNKMNLQPEYNLHEMQIASVIKSVNKLLL